MAPKPKSKTNEKIEEMIQEIRELPGDAKEIAEAIDALDDLLEPPKKIFLGYHVITGEEIWQ